MAAEAIERHDSPVVTSGHAPGVELRYVVRDAAEEIDARNAVLGAAPSTYDLAGDGTQLLIRGDVRVTPTGADNWEASVWYAPATEAAETETTPEEGEIELEISSTTQHITHSYQTTSFRPPDYSYTANHENAIGVNKDGGIDGTDVVVPVATYSEQHYLSAAVVEASGYVRGLNTLVGRVNAATFRDAQPGEMLFIGARMNKRSRGDYSVTFYFAFSPNASITDGTALTIGTVENVEKNGHDYLWVEVEDVLGVFHMTTRINAVHVEKVYLDGDFAALGVGA